MIRQREIGACFAYSRADGGAYSFAREEYHMLLTAWMAGRAFYTGMSCYGATLTVKLGDIVAVSDTPPEAMEAARLDVRADLRDDAVGA